MQTLYWHLSSPEPLSHIYSEFFVIIELSRSFFYRALCVVKQLLQMKHPPKILAGFGYMIGCKSRSIRPKIDFRGENLIFMPPS